MKLISFALFFAATALLSHVSYSYAQEDELKPYKADQDLTKLDRIDHSEAYLEKLSKSFEKLKSNFESEKAENIKNRAQIQQLIQKLNTQENPKIKELEKKVSELENKVAGLDMQQMKKDLDSSRSNFEKLSKDYTQAKMMLQQIKLLIQADYANRFSTTDSGNNKLKGIVEEINKIQLPKPTPTPMAAATATPAATTTAPAATPVSTTPTPTKQENMLDKYPLPVRQSFCRKPENLKKFKSECLPYL